MDTPASLPWRQGETLETQATRRWTKEQWEVNEQREKRVIFSRFSSHDQGRSREAVAEFKKAEDAAYACRAASNYPEVVQCLRFLVELWDSEHPDDKCGCVGASEDCPHPPPCALCVARAILEDIR